VCTNPSAMAKSGMRTLLLLLPLAALAPLAIAACPPSDNRECNTGADCGADRVCAEGRCVECAQNSDCVGDSFCCQGTCRPAADTERRCGCSPSPGGSAGSDCSREDVISLCLVDGAVATAATVARGTCACACTPAQGGPICGPPAAAGGEPVCSCDNNVECRRASVDALGRPHKAADTCTPQSRCVCFSLGTATACDPDGETPDCTSTGGCASLVADAQACGVPGRSCTAPESGRNDGAGTCVDGGCECDAADDCRGARLNVDSCQFIGDRARCVCAGYTRDNDPAPCPMELECSGGCVLDGVAYRTETALKGALGLR
jgi:hypothetical protein